MSRQLALAETAGRDKIGLGQVLLVPKINEQGPIGFFEVMLMDVVFQHAGRFFMLWAQDTLRAKSGTNFSVGEDAIPIMVDEERQEPRYPSLQTAMDTCRELVAVSGTGHDQSAVQRHVVVEGHSNLALLNTNVPLACSRCRIANAHALPKMLKHSAHLRGEQP